jgi:hypothetical protein
MKIGRVIRKRGALYNLVAAVSLQAKQLEKRKDGF